MMLCRNPFPFFKILDVSPIGQESWSVHSKEGEYECVGGAKQGREEVEGWSRGNGEDDQAGERLKH